jgi:hypothetical protein
LRSAKSNNPGSHVTNNQVALDEFVNVSNKEILMEVNICVGGLGLCGSVMILK